MADARVDPLSRCAFLVEINDTRQARFMICSAPEDETELREYREGGGPYDRS